MTISSYSELKVAIQDWSKRTDSLSLLDTFIDLAESEIYANANEPLRLRDMEVAATGLTSTTTRFLAFPTRYLELRRIKINLAQGDLKLDYETPAAMIIKPQKGMPKFYTLNSQIEFDRVSDIVYTVEMQYFQSFAPLTATNTTNALLTRFPTIYLWGALAALYQWAKQPDQSDYYYQQFLGAISKANLQDRKGRYGPTPSIKMQGPTP